MKYRQRRRILGHPEKMSSVPIPNGKVIPSDPKVIGQMNRDLRNKCKEQRSMDAEAAIWAKYHGCC